ncbi:MAG TPA: hypothetical protein ENH29_00415 [Bacteroidetes bacterium]|nr:hypothetical protein [Bacteroidota bacterium]
MENLTYVLKQQKSEILQNWIQSILTSYPSGAVNFLKNQKDQFQNPVGQTVVREAEVLLEQLLSKAEMEKVKVSLDNIIRIRAVQDFSPSQAVAIFSSLKNILIDLLATELQEEKLRREFFQLERKIDQFALLAFEIYSQCREKIYKIRLKEIKKWSGIIVEKDNEFLGRENDNYKNRLNSNGGNDS